MDTVRAPSDSSRGLDVGLDVGLDDVGLEVGSTTGASSELRKFRSSPLETA